jgi:hypothetical protein
LSSTTVRRLLAKATEGFDLRMLAHDHTLQEDIKAALDQTDRWHRRACPLRADLMMSFVLLMGLHRATSIEDLVSEVVDLLRDQGVRLPSKPITPEAVIKARARLGVEPLRVLFERRAATIDPGPSFHGLRPWIQDAVNLLVPDTEANEVAFGRPGASRGSAAFPQMKASALLDVESRQLRHVVLGRCTESERLSCAELIAPLGSEDLVLTDRGLAGGPQFDLYLQAGVHFLSRVPLYWRPTILRRLADGDYIVSIKFERPLPPERQSNRRKTETIRLTLRMIECRVGKNERVRLTTDLLDPIEFPALELAQFYHVRWDVEMAFDELKTHLATVLHGTLHTTFRSQSPGGVRQEAYALFTSYNLIRGLMLTAGRAHSVPPLDISFLKTLRTIRRAIPRFQAARPRESHALIRQLLADIAAGRNRRPRRLRRYARVVKVKMSKWKLKRRRHKQEPGLSAADTTLVRRYRSRKRPLPA